MLNTKWRLHDVDDVEAFCKQVAGSYCYKTRTELSPTDREDLVAYLIVQCWRLGERFNPTKRTARFSAYARPLLAYRGCRGVHRGVHHASNHGHPWHV